MISDDLREALRKELFRQCDEMDWANMSALAKSRQYTQWVESPDVGKRLEPFLEGKGGIRVYIKDTLLKSYHRSKQSSARIPLLHLGLDPATTHLRAFEKPHGLLLTGNRVVCWGRAADWKAILMATYERAYGANATPYGVALLDGGSKFQTEDDRRIVEEGARRLRIYQLKWVD